jgi:hypothetical protein
MDFRFRASGGHAADITVVTELDPSRTQGTMTASFPPKKRRYFNHCGLAERLRAGGAGK